MAGREDRCIVWKRMEGPREPAGTGRAAGPARRRDGARGDPRAWPAARTGASSGSAWRGRVSLLAQDARLARRVGAITFVVMAAVSAGFVFLIDQAGIRSPVRFRVMFHHSAGLHERPPLIVGGQTIGRIAAISPVLHGTPGALGGEVGVAVAVEVKGRDAGKVPAAATVFGRPRGPLADRSLEVAPPSGDPGPAIRDGAELRGVDPPTLDNVLQ